MNKFHYCERFANSKGYYIDKDGHVFNPSGKELRGRLKNGYWCFSIKDENKRNVDVRFSRLQAYQKYGDKIYEDDIVVRHLNNNKDDNSFENISIGTQHDNIMDNPFEKRKEYAINASQKASKYNKEFIEEIKEKHKQGWSYNKIRQYYNIPKSTISYFMKHKYIIYD